MTAFASLSGARRFHAARLLLLTAFAVVAALLLAMPLALHAQESGDSGYVNLQTSRLNVRGAPAASAAIVGKLESNATVTVLDVSADGAWLLVSASTLAADGWVATQFVTVGAAGGESAAASAPARGLTSAAGVTSRDVVVKSAVVVTPTATPMATAVPAAASTAAATASASASSAAVESATAATTSDTAASDTAASDTAASDETGAPVAVTRPANMNLRGGPGTHYNVIGTAPSGTSLALTGVTAAGDWYRATRANGDTAWVSAALVSTMGATAAIPTLTADEIPEAPAPSAQAPAQSAAPVASILNAPAPVGGGGFGYGITASMWQGDKAGSAHAVQDLGFTWVKQQVRWEFVEESPGAVNWQEMDDIINTMNGYGINVAFSIVTAPAWTRPNWGGTGGPPEDFQQFANFTGAVAARYCGQSLQAIEVWNEQNLRREWEGPELSPAVYMELLKRAYASIKAACPSMIVISGATTPAGPSDVAVDDIDYLRGMYQAGLANYADAIGIHPSGFANPPGVRFSDYVNGSYNSESHVSHRSFYFLSTLEESRAVMVQYGDSAKRLWPTEFGWGSAAQPWPGYEYQRRVTEQQQADWTTEAYRIMADSGYVGVAFLWNLNYNYGEMQTFSIVGRPAYAALKSLTGR